MMHRQDQTSTSPTATLPDNPRTGSNEPDRGGGGDDDNDDEDGNPDGQNPNEGDPRGPVDPDGSGNHGSPGEDEEEDEENEDEGQAPTIISTNYSPLEYLRTSLLQTSFSNPSTTNTLISMLVNLQMTAW